MVKIGIHTKDIFNERDIKKRWEWYNYCYKMALKCGLTVRCIIEDPYPELEMWGSKNKFVKYYLKTLTKCDDKKDGIKRLLTIIACS